MVDFDYWLQPFLLEPLTDLQQSHNFYGPKGERIPKSRIMMQAISSSIDLNINVIVNIFHA